MAELTRVAVRDIPAGRGELVAAPAVEGMREFRVVYDTNTWPVDSAETVTLKLFVKKGTRSEVEVWSDTIAYKRATKRDTTQVAGATIDGGVPDSSSVRFEVIGPALRTAVILEGE